ncbi:sulfatase-like hydrolase/transferase [Salinarchaeum sp. Harcht-Bsk1]|uniref:sulfatase-like hydrolase/transferase n=1 Tax=Salinarchaeum sp. Harcht-Bsk1 TaxID=1333523 RepID=UPI0021012B17|nr:sulfatase-like hydrolase/transferase [Salinarchaeum sp. Harcht-Bsk1]
MSQLLNNDIVDDVRVDRVVLVLVDCLRFDAYQSSMPNLRRLANEHIEFSDHHSLGPMTPASVPALFQSRQPIEHGGAGMALREDIPSIAEVLSREGVNTAGWHSNTYVSAESGYSRGFDSYVDLGETGTENDEERSNRGDISEILARLNLQSVAESVLDALKRQGLIQWTNQPDAEEFFDKSMSWMNTGEQEFHYIHLMDPHFPYFPPASYRKENSKTLYNLNQLIQDDPSQIDHSELEILRSTYLQEVSYVDDRIAEFVDYLRSSGEWDSTALVITADHGELFRDKTPPSGMEDITHPSYCCEELIHVPLVIAGGGIPNNSISKVTSAEDVSPLICDLFGAEIPPEWDRDELFECPVAVSSSMHQREKGVTISEDFVHISVRSDQETILWWSNETPTEYYHRDNGEERVSHNEIDEKKLHSVCETVSLWADSIDEQTDIGGEVSERLRQLGYVED